MIRVKIQSVIQQALQYFTGTGRPGEVLKNRELMQEYGFVSRPKEGAEGIAIRVGNNVVMIATRDRRYTLPIANGEVALFTDEGDNIHFKRGKLLELNCGTKITLTAPSVLIDAQHVDLGGTDGQGVVTRGCICAFTGGPHPDASFRVKAKK